MAEKKKKIKQCRVKADTCFKWHCIGKMFGLSLEDIGLAYMISQIKDDEGGIIHSLIEPEILDMYKEREAEWMALHSAKMKSDPLYRIAFADLNGQRTATTNHYKAEVKRREAYNKKVDEQNDEEETVATSDEVKNDVYPALLFTVSEKQYEYELTSNIENEDNIPKAVDFLMIETKARNEYGMEDKNIVHLIKTAIKDGNEDGWKHSIMEYAEGYYICEEV